MKLLKGKGRSYNFETPIQIKVKTSSWELRQDSLKVYKMSEQTIEHILDLRSDFQYCINEQVLPKGKLTYSDCLDSNNVLTVNVTVDTTVDVDVDVNVNFNANVNVDCDVKNQDDNQNHDAGSPPAINTTPVVCIITIYGFHKLGSQINMYANLTSISDSVS